MVGFGSVNLKNSDYRRGDWQKHHVVPTQQRGLEGLQDLFEAISDTNLPLGVRYEHDVFDFNGLLMIMKGN